MNDDYFEFWNKVLFIIDSFKTNPNIEFEEGIFEKEEYRCFYAALVEFLINKNNKQLPEWINKKEYKLKTPWFINDYKTADLRILIMVEAPVEFKSRNIFIETDAFNRC